MSKSLFPPNVPPFLVKQYHDAGDNLSELARRLEVNKGHLSKLFSHGIEPRRKDIREKLHLPAKVRESVPAWVTLATQTLADLEKNAPPIQKRIYSRDGKRVR